MIEACLVLFSVDKSEELLTASPTLVLIFNISFSQYS